MLRVTQAGCYLGDGEYVDLYECRPETQVVALKALIYHFGEKSEFLQSCWFHLPKSSLVVLLLGDHSSDMFASGGDYSVCHSDDSVQVAVNVFSPHVKVW